MKKSNPLLAKYLSFEHGNMLAQMTPKQIETEYVSKAYNGFGFDFHNKIIPEVQEQLMNDVQPDDWVLDIGCGNGEYRKVLPDTCVYIGM